MNRLIRRVLLLGFVFVLAACEDTNTLTTGDGGGGTPGGATPAAIVLSSTSNQLSADADSQAEGLTLSAIVLDSGGRTIEGATVTFSLGALGTGALIVTQGTTDASGIAQAILTTGGNALFPRTISVTASTGSVSDSADVSVVDPSTPPSTSTASQLTLFASDDELFSDADSATEGVTITAAVMDDDGIVVENVAVAFAITTANGALQVTRSTTNSSGTAVAVLTTGGIETPRTITVAGTITTTTGTTITRTVNVSVVANAAEVIGTLSSFRLPNDDSVPIEIRARAADASDNPLINVPVTFFASSGALSSGGGAASNSVTVLTNNAGETPIVTLTTGGDDTPRAITITMSAPGANADSAEILVVPAVASIQILASASSLLADADTAAEGVTLFALLTDSAGNVIAGEPVEFTITSGQGALQVVSGTTDATGRASAILTSGCNINCSFPRAISVSAEAQDLMALRTINVVDPDTPPEVQEIDEIALLTSSLTLASDADTVAEGAILTAIVTDENGNLVSGATVSFAITASTGALQVTNATTGEDGAATAVLTTGGNATARTVTVTASATGSGGTVEDDIQVTVTAGGAVCATCVSLSGSAPEILENADTAAEGVIFTALVRDASGVALSGKPITFLVTSSGGTSRNGVLQVTQGTTGADGKATAILTVGQAIPGDALTVRATFDAPSGTDPFSVATVVVADISSAIESIDLLTSAPQLSSNAIATANGVTITAVVKDASQTVMQGVPVTFTITSSGPTGSGTLTPVNLTTDATGSARTILTTGGNRRNRFVTVTASAPEFDGTVTPVSIQVVGTTLTISGPSNTQSDPTTYTAVLLDAGGGPISGQEVTFDYIAGDLNGMPDDGPGGVGDDNECQGGGTFAPSSGMVNTDVSGIATIDLTPSDCGVLTATGLGASDQQDINVSTDCFSFVEPDQDQEIPLVPAAGSTQTVTVLWEEEPCDGSSPVVGATIDFSSTRGTLSAAFDTTDGSGEASVTISSLQAGEGIINASSTDGSKPTTSVNVEFVATVPASVAVQASPATIATNQQSTISAVVRDAANNLVKNATVKFTLTDTTGGTLSAGQAITNSQGRAQVTYTASSTPSAANGVIISGTVTAVDGDPVTQVSGETRLTVGSAGLSITLGTGNQLSEEGATTYVLPYRVSVTDAANNAAPDAQVSLSVHPIIYRKGTSAWNGVRWVRTDGSGGSPVECLNEDLLTGDADFDLNGILDLGEDLNEDGRLQPGGVAQVPSTVILDDENGSADFEIRYPQDVAYWVRVRLRAIASVAGTESVTETFFDLPGIASDFTNVNNAPPGEESPYGTLQDCAHTGTASFSSSDTIRGVDPDTTVTLVVTLTQPAGVNPISIPFTVGGTATGGGVDYTLTPGSPLVIPPGGSAALITVDVGPTPTPGETVVVTLLAPESQATLGSPKKQTLVLDGAAVNFASTTLFVTDAGSGTYSATLTLDRAVGADVDVSFTCGGTATVGDDYSVTASPITITAGELSADMDFMITTSGAAEDDETIVCTLTGVTGPAVIDEDFIHTLTIVGDP